MRKCVSFFRTTSFLFLGFAFLLGTPSGLAAEQYLSDNSAKQDLMKDQKLQGSFSVGEFTGAAVYEYPLVLPEGRNGLTPNLSLTYNSQDTNLHNQVGYMWSLTDFSIQHMNKAGVDKFYDQNGQIGRNDFIANTPFGSGELIALNLSDQHHGTYAEKYETSFASYEYQNDDSWLVIDKNGNQFAFGKTQATRQFDPQNPNRIFQWKLEEIRDKNDNFIRYTYQKLDNQIYPEAIHYTGHGNEEGIFEVRFILDPNVREDSQFSYANGFLVTTNHVIERIEVYAEDNLRRKYTLNYGKIEPLVRKTLDSIEETGFTEKGDPTVLPDTIFEYTPSVISWKESQNYTAPLFFVTCPNNDNCTPHKAASFWDVTGDGLVDIPENNLPKIFTNNGKGGWLYQEGNNYNLNGPTLSEKTIDFDGDGRTDHLTSHLELNNNVLEAISHLDLSKEVFTEYANTVKVGLRSESNNTNFYDNGTSMGDLNGDGLPDMIQRRLKTNQTFTTSTCLNQDGINCTLTNLWQSPENIIVDNAQTQNSRNIYVQDCNQDGLADVYHSGLAKKWLNDGKGGWIVANNDERCQFPGTADGLFSRSEDLNGDGLIDQIHALWEVTPNNDIYVNELHLNTGITILPDVGDAPIVFGRGNGTGQNKTDVTGIRLMDINADGLPDMVQSFVNYEKNEFIKHTYLHTGSKPYFLKTVH